MKKRNNKRKTYLRIFLHKAIPTTLVYAVLMLILISTFCQSQQQCFLDNQVMLASSLKDTLIENDTPSNMPIRLAFRTFEQTDALKTHAWITDSQTGEQIASSDKILFWGQPQKGSNDDGESKKSILRSCNYDLIKDQLGEYTDQHPQNAILSADGYVYPIYPLNGYEKYLYYYSMDDVYYTDTTFYPGTLNIEISEETTSDLNASLKQIASVSLTPENPEDYKYMYLNDENNGLDPIVIGDSYSIENFPLACDNLNTELDSEIYTATLCAGEYADMYARYDFTDATGHEYRLHYTARLNYWTTAGRYMALLTIIVALLILGIVALLAKKEYNTLRSFY